jgi:hypothetical protein
MVPSKQCDDSSNNSNTNDDNNNNNNNNNENDPSRVHQRLYRIDDTVNLYVETRQ